MRISSGNKWARRVVQRLVYPAVLGAIFYNLLPLFFDWPRIVAAPAFAIGEILIIGYFAVDYHYTISYPRYGIVSGMCDFAALVMLYRVEFLINPLHNNRFDPHASLLMSAIHFLWLVWVIAERDYIMIPVKLGFAVLFLLQYYFFPNMAAFAALQFLLVIGYAISAIAEIRRRNRMAGRVIRPEAG